MCCDGNRCKTGLSAQLRGWAAATLSRHIAAGPTADTTGNATTRRALARSVFAPTHPLPPTPFCCPPPLSSIISISPPFMSLYSPIPPALSASLLHLLTAGGAHGDGAVRWPDRASRLRRRCVRAWCMLSPRHDEWYGSWGEQPLSRCLFDVRGAGCSGGVGGSWLCVTSCIARFSRTILLPRFTRSLPLLVW